MKDADIIIKNKVSDFAIVGLKLILDKIAGKEKFRVTIERNPESPNLEIKIDEDW